MIHFFGIALAAGMALYPAMSGSARAVAQEIGLLRPGHEVLTGADLDRMSDDILKNEIEQDDSKGRLQEGEHDRPCRSGLDEPVQKNEPPL